MEIKISNLLEGRKLKNGKRNFMLRARFIDRADEKKRIEVRPLCLNGKPLSFYSDQFKAQAFTREERIYYDLFYNCFKDVIEKYRVLDQIPNASHLKNDLQKAIESRLDETDLRNANNLDAFGKDSIAQDVQSELNLMFNEINRSDALVDEGTEIEPEELLVLAEARVAEKKLKQDSSTRFRYRKILGINNLYELFGIGHANKKHKNEPKMNKEYRKLLKCLHDYRVNSNNFHSHDIRDLDKDWIDEFFKFFIDEGYAKISKNCTDPNDWFSMDAQLKNAERAMYSVSSFTNVVKWMKSYLQLMWDEGLVKLDFSPNLLKAKDYYYNTQNDSYSRRNHSLLEKEFNELLDKEFTSIDLNRARIQFIISVVFGGLRNAELLSPRSSINKVEGEYQFDMYISKTNKFNLNPIFAPYDERVSSILDANNGDFERVEEHQYRELLKEIAIKMNWTREIKLIESKVDKKSPEVSFSPLHDVFVPYFARKTFTTLARRHGLTDSQIRAFTDHSRDQTLRHYLGDVAVEDKRNYGK